jgi:hypothetical protein
VQRARAPLLSGAFLLLAATACGSGTGAGRATTAATGSTAPAGATTSTSGGTGGGGGAGALVAEAQSAAAGDIPDNQVFLTYRSARGRWSIKFPEGWARTGSATRTVFRDKNNLVRIVIAPGALPTTAQAHALIGRARQAAPSIHIGTPQRMTISGHPSVKVTYSTVSAPNLVTNRRVTLMVDRYYLSHGGRVAVVDLGTPVGVDNVDAYRMMIQSFTWR